MNWECIDCTGFDGGGRSTFVFQSDLVAVFLEHEADIRMLWHFAALDVDE